MLKRPFGDKIRTARKRKGLSLMVVSERAGISLSYLSQIENGRREPPDDKTIATLAVLLEIDITELLKIAHQDKLRVELGLLNLGPKKRELAITLQRSWDELSELDALEIEKILSKFSN